jgi:hypothetical protein
MNLVREAFSLPGYVYNYVAGSRREASSEPLLEQARVQLNAAKPESQCRIHSQHCQQSFSCMVASKSTCFSEDNLAFVKVGLHFALTVKLLDKCFM